MATSVKLAKALPKNSALFLCDMQEKFRNMISYYPQILITSARVLQAAKALDIPVVVTEQYPKGLNLLLCNRTHLWNRPLHNTTAHCTITLTTCQVIIPVNARWVGTERLSVWVGVCPNWAALIGYQNWTQIIQRLSPKQGDLTIVSPVWGMTSRDEK